MTVLDLGATLGVLLALTRSMKPFDMQVCVSYILVFFYVLNETVIYEIQYKLNIMPSGSCYLYLFVKGTFRWYGDVFLKDILT